MQLLLLQPLLRPLLLLSASVMNKLHKAGKEDKMGRLVLSPDLNVRLNGLIAVQMRECQAMNK